MQENTIINLFIEVLDDSSVLIGESLKSRFYHIWKTDIQLESLCLLLPRTTDEVSSIVKICNDNNQEIIIHGGLTNLVGSTISNKTQVVISLEKMNRVIEVDESAKTITCESGVIIEDVINTVKDKNLLLPLNCGARGSAQIGGAVSTNAGGLRFFKYGMTRNLVMGIEAVLPDGTIISSLKKLMKDNSGYDLKQLFIGSEGTLGIVTKVVLRLYRLPKTRYTSLAVSNNYQDVLNLLKIMEDKNVTLVSDQSNETAPNLTGSSMTKAGRLAMELSHEKKRLKQELEELQTEYDEIKPTTPTGTTDWYVKWLSMLLAVAGIFLISASLTLYGQIAYVISCVGWIYVGMQWGDRAIMIGSAVSCTAIAMNLVNTLT